MTRYTALGRRMMFSSSAAALAPGARWLRDSSVLPPDSTAGYDLVKMVAEYLEHAMQFERMALAEANRDLKAKFLKQAADYRKLATKRAAHLRLPERIASQSR
jgi:hypothetical protein